MIEFNLYSVFYTKLLQLIHLGEQKIGATQKMLLSVYLVEVVVISLSNTSLCVLLFFLIDQGWMRLSIWEASFLLRGKLTRTRKSWDPEYGKISRFSFHFIRWMHIREEYLHKIRIEYYLDLFGCGHSCSIKFQRRIAYRGSSCCTSFIIIVIHCYTFEFSSLEHRRYDLNKTEFQKISEFYEW